MKICGLTILHNEEQILPHTLACNLPICDVVVALAHNCTDRTVEILKQYNKVQTIIPYHGVWDEPKMRNLTIAEGKKFDPDLFFVFDGDELYEIDAREKLIEAAQTNPEALSFDVILYYCYCKSDFFLRKFQATRGFRNIKGKEQTLGKKWIHINVAPDDVLKPRILTPVRGKHLCVLNAEDARDKFHSYRERDPACVGQAGYGHQLRVAYNLANHNAAIHHVGKVPFEIAANLQQVDLSRSNLH